MLFPDSQAAIARQCRPAAKPASAPHAHSRWAAPRTPPSCCCQQWLRTHFHLKRTCGSNTSHDRQHVCLDKATAAEQLLLLLAACVPLTPRCLLSYPTTAFLIHSTPNHIQLCSWSLDALMYRACRAPAQQSPIRSQVREAHTPTHTTSRYKPTHDQVPMPSSHTTCTTPYLPPEPRLRYPTHTLSCPASVLRCPEGACRGHRRQLRRAGNAAWLGRSSQLARRRLGSSVWRAAGPVRTRKQERAGVCVQLQAATLQQTCWGWRHGCCCGRSGRGRRQCRAQVAAGHGCLEQVVRAPRLVASQQAW